jgi:hypothetical protein
MNGPRKNLGLRLATLALIAAFSLARGLRTRVCVDPLADGELGARVTAPLALAPSVDPPAPPSFERLHTPLDIPVTLPECAGEPRGGERVLRAANLAVPACPFAARDRRDPLRC